jgi:repressor LexA
MASSTDKKGMNIMKMKLTRKQQEGLMFISEFTQSHGYPPTVRELQKAMGYHSTSSAFEIFRNLEKKGVIHRTPGSPRAIEIITEVMVS